MENTFNTDELVILRQSLEVITIQGKNARQVADLQTKLENLIDELHTLNLPSNTKVKTN